MVDIHSKITIGLKEPLCTSLCQHNQKNVDADLRNFIVFSTKNVDAEENVDTGNLKC